MNSGNRTNPSCAKLDSANPVEGYTKLVQQKLSGDLFQLSGRDDEELQQQPVVGRLLHLLPVHQPLLPHEPGSILFLNYWLNSTLVGQSHCCGAREIVLFYVIINGGAA